LNQHGKVLDANAKDAEGEYVTSNNKNGKIHQEWRIVYIDARDKEITKGMDVSRGMYVNRPFFIVSRMWMNRVMSVHSNWAVLIKSRVDPKADKNRQVWTYDITSKTIKSNHQVTGGKLVRSLDVAGGNVMC
jgi:hypothetical protein